MKSATSPYCHFGIHDQGLPAAGIVSTGWQEYCNCISVPSIAVAGEPGKRHPRRAHKPPAVSDWLNPNSLGTMSAFGYIENLA